MSHYVIEATPAQFNMLVQAFQTTTASAKADPEMAPQLVGQLEELCGLLEDATTLEEFGIPDGGAIDLDDPDVRETVVARLLEGMDKRIAEAESEAARLLEARGTLASLLGSV